MSDWVDVAPASEFPPGTWRSVDLEGSPVAVFNLDREYYESRMCARMTAASSPAARWERDEIVCPRHGAHFSVKTGQALTPPAYEMSPHFPSACRKEWFKCGTCAGIEGGAQSPHGAPHNGCPWFRRTR
jgi:3-phenylpropionate/trans-cinnamate dioxygenase ferredoxin subunit